jgi:hypothetical protein
MPFPELPSGEMISEHFILELRRVNYRVAVEPLGRFGIKERCRGKRYRQRLGCSNSNQVSVPTCTIHEHFHDTWQKRMDFSSYCHPAQFALRILSIRSRIRRGRLAILKSPS